VPWVVAPALVAAGLLAFAGAQKLLDPTMTAGALRALGWPGSNRLVRLGAGVELAVGVLAIALGGAVWWLVALSYAGFNVFVGQALRRGTPLGTCGCFGRADTPPSRRHLALNLIIGGVAGASTALDAAPIDELGRIGASEQLVLLFVSLAASAVVYQAYVGGRAHRH
jgi:hypothetical protein